MGSCVSIYVGAFDGFTNQGRTDAFVAQLREEEDTTPPPAECEVFEGDLIINSPADTVQTDPFDGCFDVTGGVYVQDTSGITDLSFLSGLRSVGTFLAISDNADLVSLDGLDMCALEFAGLLHIENNDVLAGFCFEALSQVDGRFRIAYNHALSTCAAEALLQDVGPANLRGPVTIEGNDDSRICS